MVYTAAETIKCRIKIDARMLTIIMNAYHREPGSV